MAATIAAVRGREILDSRGNPTVEVDVLLSDGSLGRAAVPSGASTGRHEALELRDGDAKRFGGAGVLKAVANVNKVLGPVVLGQEPFDQPELDRLLRAQEESAQLGPLGANATLGISLAIACAAAASRRLPLYRYLAQGLAAAMPGRQEAPLLPVPMFNILNGGKHASGSVDVQEFMVVPMGAPSFREALRAGVEVYQALKRLLRSRGQSVNVGDEGGFAPALGSNREALQAVREAVRTAGYTPDGDVCLAMDVAATELYRDGKYVLAREKAEFATPQWIDYLEGLVREFSILSVEDGMAEDDWEGWRLLTQRLGDRVQLVGDDVYTTRPERIQRGVDMGASNAVLIKPNQIGTVTETLEAIAVGKQAGWGTVVSHRSGETEDTFIADLAVATGAGQIKTGAPARSERVAKYNRLLRIEEELGEKARFAGAVAYGHLRR
ncbi:MAG: phosphopyruvate hydratase [Chloroflexi bacterium]|nr:phosphopyruvate hydratase [Chloroflexota bacterium]